jgi:hypothetical protein
MVPRRGTDKVISPLKSLALYSFRHGLYLKVDGKVDKLDA